jgi:hypothetical protein
LGFDVAVGNVTIIEYACSIDDIPENEKSLLFGYCSFGLDESLKIAK